MSVAYVAHTSNETVLPRASSTCVESRMTAVHVTDGTSTAERRRRRPTQTVNMAATSHRPRQQQQQRRRRRRSGVQLSVHDGARQPQSMTAAAAAVQQRGTQHNNGTAAAAASPWGRPALRAGDSPAVQFTSRFNQHRTHPAYDERNLCHSKQRNPPSKLRNTVRRFFDNDNA